MQKEEYEEGMSIDEDIPVAATLTDLEIFQAVCGKDQEIKVGHSDGDECVEENEYVEENKCVDENHPTKAEMRPQHRKKKNGKAACNIVQQIEKQTSENNINEMLRNKCRQATINDFF
ncbi:hypothetical protein AVEN_106648-1 [Araneus ventricosus]|uniref:Uncharacterized protein n=1 Tax=Araneus ventricosus TaxID=182803 RepID=A0A4Y2QW46_ARAVE|nr:hypothetical protein AVEN_106648-1 [Araneus ventricosus]